MCDKYTCAFIGGIATIAVSIVAGPFGIIPAVLFGSGAYAFHRLDHSTVVRLLNRLEAEYQERNRAGTLEAVVRSPKNIFNTLYLPGNWAKLVDTAQNARDNLLFKDTPPSVKDAQGYLAVQRKLPSIDERLLYVLDPHLFVGTRRKPFLLDTDLSSCRDGTYRTSMIFAVTYRNIIGEPMFQSRLENFQSTHNLVGKNPWYFGRAEYEARLSTRTRGDSF